MSTYIGSLISILILFQTSCSINSQTKKYRVGFSQCVSADRWRQTMLEEMKRELSFQNNIEFLYRDAGANSQTQIKQIEELVNSHIDLLIVSPNEVKPLTPIIENLYDRGIKVVIVDRRINSQKYTAFVGASNFEVGQNAGIYAALILKGKGNVIELTGLPDASPVIDRHNGFMNIISHYPDIHYVKKIDVNSKPFLTIQENTLKENKNINLIFAQNDFMAYDAYMICKKLGIKKYIIGIDGLSAEGAGMDFVAKKYISATVFYPTGGQEAIITALKILEHKKFNKEYPLVTSIIDSTNIRILKLQSQKVIAQQKEIDERQNLIDKQISLTRNQSEVIFIITLAFTVAIIFAGISFYFLRENKKINRVLEEQKNQLILISKKEEMAHQAKMNFFTNISHEFRTPLTLILSPLEDLLSNPKLSSAISPTLLLVQKNVMRLYRLVNQLMDFRKIELNKMKMSVSNVDLIHFSHEIFDSFKVLAKNKNIGFQFFTRETELRVWMDIMMIDKVIFNLLSNAFKFTQKGGYIHLRISKEGQNAVIRVEDDGIGIGPESLQHIFEPFYQKGSETYKGTGLGLALSKELIEFHKGKISFTSQNQKGSIFEIQIPLGKEHFGKEVLVSYINADSLIEEDSKLYVTELMESKNQEEINSMEGCEKKYTLLIVEDNDDLREYLKSKLIHQYDVILASNSNSALEIVFDIIPDIIICDIIISGKNGMEITQIIKEDVRTSFIPVILLTALADEKLKIQGLKTGADAYITKPFNIGYVQQTIENLLSNREKTKVHFSGLLINEDKSKTSKKSDRKFISEFTSIVEKNIPNENFSIENICLEMGISRIQLYRKVKKIMDYSVNDYIVHTRLQKAKYYMQHEDLTISEIAFKVGFSSSSYFSTAFKTAFGVSPTDYKQNKPIADKHSVLPVKVSI